MSDRLPYEELTNPTPDSAFFRGELKLLARSLDAAFMLASTDDTRPHLAQVALGTLHERKCLAASNGHALIVHWLDDSERSSRPRGKRSFSAQTTLGPGDWRLLKAIIGALPRHTLGTVTLSARSLTLEVFEPKPQTFTIACGEEAVRFPPIAYVLASPKKRREADARHAYTSVHYMERMMGSMRKHAEFYGTRADCLPSQVVYGADAFSAVFVHTQHSLGIVMPMRVGDGDFAYGHAFWEAV